MTFCPNCGAQASGSFCPNCGTPLGSSSGQQASGFASSSAVGAGSQGISDNVAGALCYTPFVIGIVCSIVFLIISPYSRNRTVRFHALQSLFLHLALVVLSIAFSVFVGVFALLTHGLGVLLVGLHPILWLATLVLLLVLMFQTYNKQKTMLPIIGEMADKQA